MIVRLSLQFLHQSTLIPKLKHNLSLSGYKPIEPKHSSYHCVGVKSSWMNDLTEFTKRIDYKSPFLSLEKERIGHQKGFTIHSFIKKKREADDIKYMVTIVFFLFRLLFPFSIILNPFLFSTHWLVENTMIVNLFFYLFGMFNTLTRQNAFSISYFEPHAFNK